MKTRRAATSTASICAFLCVLVLGCSKRDDQAGGADRKEGSKPGPIVSSAPVQRDVVADARKLVAEGQTHRVVETLGDNQSAEALEMLLALLDLPDSQVQTRVKAIRALGQWRTERERIGQEFVTRLPTRGTQEASLLLVAVAQWGLKQHAPALAQLLATTKDRGLWQPLSDALCKIATPECSPILLGALSINVAQDMQYSRSKDARRFLTSKEHYEVLKRAIEIMPVLAAIGDPGAVPVLIEYLKVDIYNHTWRPASIALGRIGTEEAIAAIEKQMDERGRSPETRELFLAGLMRSTHSRGRTSLSAALADADPSLRREAVVALVETARPADSGLVTSALENADPVVVQYALQAAPRLLPEGRSTLEQAFDRASGSGSHRTALGIAQALADSRRTASAQSGLDRLRQSIWSEPRLDAWFGKTQKEVLAKFSDAKLQRHVRRQEAPTMIVTTDWGSTFDVPGKLSFWGGKEASGPFMGVEAREKYDQPVYGIRVGDPALLVWQIHGESERDPISTDLVYLVAAPNGPKVRLRYKCPSNRVGRIEIRSES